MSPNWDLALDIFEAKRHEKRLLQIHRSPLSQYYKICSICALVENVKYFNPLLLFSYLIPLLEKKYGKGPACESLSKKHAQLLMEKYYVEGT